MKEVILHIGHGKTGTSAIQSYLALNANKLSELGINYPQSLDFESAKAGKITSGNGSLIFDNYDNDNDNDNDEEKTTLYSSEHLFFQLHSEQEFTKLVLERFSKVTVILYTRNVLEMLFSVWGQMTKRGANSRSLAEYVTTTADRHHEIAVKWLRLSKQLNFDIIIRNYSNHRHDVLDDFMSVVTDIVNIKQGNMAHLIKPQTPTINRSMTQAEYAVLQCFNSVDPNFSARLSDAWVERLPEIKSETPPFSKGAVLNLKARYEDILLELNDYVVDSENIFFGENDEIHSATTNAASLTHDHISIFAELLQQRPIERKENKEISEQEFDPNVYLELHQDVKAAGVNPYQHYLEFGIKEGRRIR